MEIRVKDRKLKAALYDEALCVRRFGKPMANYIQDRMDALRAAETLGDFWPPNRKPLRVHELRGELSGEFSIDLKQPYRLLFRPILDSDAEFADEKERWQQIKEVEILRVENTHG